MCKYSFKYHTISLYDEYLTAIAEDLNSRRAKEIVEDTTIEDAPILSNLLKLKQGYDSGIDTWQQNMRLSSDMLHGNDRYVAPTAQQMASVENRQQMAEQGMLFQTAYDVATGLGQMTPSLMASTVSDVLLPGSGKILGAGMMGLSSAGGAYQDAINRGYTPDQARGYGILTGASEAGLGYLLSGIGKLGGKFSGQAVKTLTDKIDNVLLKLAATYGGNMLSEFGEEYLQSVLTPFFENLTLGTDHDIDLLSEDALYEGMIGALNAGFIGAGSNAFSQVNGIPDAQTIADQNLMFKTQTGKTEGVDFDRKGRAFDPVREASFKVMDSIARSTGKQFHVYESYVNQEGKRVYQNSEGQEVAAPNGFYQNGEIYVDLNAGETGKGTMLFTAAHELTHHIRKASPDQFNALAEAVMEVHGDSRDSLIQRQIEKAARQGLKLTPEEALEEVVADSMESMLQSGNVTQMLAKLRRQNMPLFQKVTSWLKDTTANLHSAVDAYKDITPETPEGKAIAQMNDTVGALENIYTHALADAGIKSNDTSQSNLNHAVKYSLLLKNSNGQAKIVNPYEVTKIDVLDYMSMSKKQQLETNAYFPVRSNTPKVLLDTLRAEGIDIPDRPLAMQVKKARQAQLEEKPFKKDGIIIRQHALKAEEILEVIDKLDMPEAIIHQQERTKIIKIDGEKVLVEAPDNYAVFVTLDNGKECVAIVEFESTIDEKYIVRDGIGEEYHTTVTVFAPDVVRDGEPFDYIEFLLLKDANREIDIKKESSRQEAAIARSMPQLHNQEPSKVMLPHSNGEIKRKNSLRNQATTPQQFTRWAYEAEAARAAYGDIDFGLELQNPEFVRLLQSGVGVKDAYFLAHKDEILMQAMHTAALGAEEKVNRRIAQNRARPRENGLDSSAAFITKPNISHMTKADRQSIARRVANGERIVF